ncbi:hypothetical protein ACVBEH_07960 [Roseateles sp. GG27B]
MEHTETDVWKKTACIICSLNCGLEIKTEGGRITKIKGDKSNPIRRATSARNRSAWTSTKMVLTALTPPSAAGLMELMKTSIGKRPSARLRKS